MSPEVQQLARDPVEYEVSFSSCIRALKNMAFSQRLPKAIDAMKRVYGNFEKDITALTNYEFPPNPQGHNGRYLWTDAFGVCNFVSLYRVSRDSRYLILAERLVEVVHRVLGSTRDGTRLLPGADQQHPLRGGLRIGKLAASGIDSDGQYYHYLTMWMFALNRLAKVTNKAAYNDLGIELAQSIHPKFVTYRNGHPKIVWKMNTDLTDVLVSNEGNLDAAQGYLAYSVLQEANRQDPNVLKKEISDLHTIVSNRAPFQSHNKDPLDLGMGLWITHYFADLQNEEWAKPLKKNQLDNVDLLFRAHFFDPAENPLDRRLAFREFGLAMGLACLCSRTAEDNSKEYEKRKSQVEQILGAWEGVILSPSPRRSIDLSFLRRRVDDEDAERHIDLVMYASAVYPVEFQTDGNMQTF